MNEETNMTNDQNVNADERGQRRQTAAVRKATKEYEDAHDLAKTSDSTSEREHADDLRKVLIAEVQEARLSLPPPTNGAGPSPLASALAKVFAAFSTDFLLCKTLARFAAKLALDRFKLSLCAPSFSCSAWKAPANASICNCETR